MSQQTADGYVFSERTTPAGDTWTMEVKDSATGQVMILGSVHIGPGFTLDLVGSTMHLSREGLRELATLFNMAAKIEGGA